MKKLLFPIVAAVAVAAAGAVFLFSTQKDRQPFHPIDALPANTFFFAELPSYARTSEKWRQTAVSQLWNEPEVQAFLEKPKASLPSLQEFEKRLRQIDAIQPRHIFVAAVGDDLSNPGWIAGFSFKGAQADVEKALEEPRAEMKKAWPAGKSDIVPYKGCDIQTYTDEENVIAEAFQKEAYLVSNNADLLRHMLDALSMRREGENAGLAKDPVFQKVHAALPVGADLSSFIRLSLFTDRLATLAATAGQQADPAQFDALKKTRAIGYAMKLDGAQIRDTTFLYAPGHAAPAALPLNSLATTTAATLVYFAGRFPATDAASQSSIGALAKMPAFAEVEKALGAKGLALSDAGTIFGPEVSLAFDWPQGSPPSTPLVGAEIHDQAKAEAFVHALLGDDTAWNRRENDGTVIFEPSAPATPPAQGSLLPFATPLPVIGLSDKFMVIGLDPKTVADGLARIKAGGASLGTVAAFETARKSVAEAGAAFGYVDLRSLVERTYGMFRPFLVMSLAFNSEAAKYIDVGKLPSTETLTKHLGPIIYSQSSSADGETIELAGPLTLSQTFAVALGGAVTAAYPMIEQTLKNGVPALPGLGAPRLAQPPAGPPSVRPPEPPAGPVSTGVETEEKAGKPAAPASSSAAVPNP